MLVWSVVPITAASGGLVDMGFKGTITGSGQSIPTLLCLSLQQQVLRSSVVISEDFSKRHRRHVPEATLHTRQSCTVLGEGKAEPLVPAMHGQALLVKTSEKPANRILTTLFRLQTGFREKATTAELQTWWYTLSLVKAELPAHLTLSKNEVDTSIYYKNTDSAHSLERTGKLKSDLLKHKASRVTFFKKTFIVWKYFDMPLNDEKYFTVYFEAVHI